MGRVTNYMIRDNGLVEYEVRFPNGRQADFSETRLFVRPWNAPEDPAEVLAAGGAESQYLYDRRNAASSALLSLRSAAQGLTSIPSAGVDFVPHQVAAVRRVLTDPIQRYLLADEVGLGKTIEAGLIVRQHLIDDPDTSVLIVVPSHLRGQWRAELAEKLRLNQFGEAFECVSHADLERITRVPDILVVDEAHHLVGTEAGPLTRSSGRLRDLAARTSVLLLLSATPALGDEARFLALLNLLDPTTHPLDDIKGFRSKLEQRRAFGRVLLSLDPGSPQLVLRQRSAELLRLLPDDPFVAEMAPRLAAAAREASNEVAPLCAALKEHIADSYRIHQRLIRSRRADAAGWEFMPRGPRVGGEPNLAHVKTESNPDEPERLLAALEDWRFSAIDAVGENEKLLDRLAARHARFLAALSVSPFDLAHEIEQAEPLFDGEFEFLENLAANPDDQKFETRMKLMVESTKRLFKTLRSDAPHPKIVVFSSSTAVAISFFGALTEQIEDVPAFLLTDAADEERANAVSDFATPHRAGLLVTDRCGEEGLNLACADAIVHLDLPFSATRLEQRIGRLDRFGRLQKIIRHRVLLPSDEDGSPWTAWLDFLSRGFLIFNQSISDVQFLLEGFEVEAFRRLLLNGPNALAALAGEMRERIEEERQSQDEQYALDRIALAEEPVEDFIQALDDAEVDERQLELNVDQWLIGVLQFKKRPFAWPDKDPFKLYAAKGTLVPRVPWLSKFGVDDSQPFTWRRRIATRNSAVTLLRPGTPLVDITERFTRWDDRGTAFVTWRVAPDFGTDLWVGFRLCFVIEPDIQLSDLLAPKREELAAIRRAQRYLAPKSRQFAIDINGEEVRDPKLLNVLGCPYRNRERTEH